MVEVFLVNYGCGHSYHSGPNGEYEAEHANVDIMATVNMREDQVCDRCVESMKEGLRRQYSISQRRLETTFEQELKALRSINKFRINSKTTKPAATCLSTEENHFLALTPSFTPSPCFKKQMLEFDFGGNSETPEPRPRWAVEDGPIRDLTPLNTPDTDEGDATVSLSSINGQNARFGLDPEFENCAQIINEVTNSTPDLVMDDSALTLEEIFSLEGGNVDMGASEDLQLPEFTGAWEKVEPSPAAALDDFLHPDWGFFPTFNSDLEIDFPFGEDASFSL